MCGVFGTFELRDDGRVERSLDLLAHRGPDGRGIASLGEAVHGHVRLSLVDLTDASAQPMRAGGGLLSFVGEVWNWRELAAERGWTVPGDTALLARMLAADGVAATLPRLDGMFAFAWSSPTEDVLARDRFGKVPLFVRRRGRSFEWSSERKAWGVGGGLASPLPPGSVLDLRTGRSRTWYKVPEEAEESDVAELIEEATAKRLAADAPVCVLASGGLDSSLVLAAAVGSRGAAAVTAYHAWLDPGSADLREARRFCRELGVELREVRLPEPTPELLSEAVRTVETASKAQAEIAFACVPLARRIAEDGFKACLSGEGADELFGGYGNSRIRAASLDDAGWRAHRLQLLEKMSRGNFVRCNLAFMAAGVECRLPFMERRLVEGVLAMGKDGCPPGKVLLKAAARGTVPDRLIDRVKETFQGGSGVAKAAARAVADPLHFYHAECRKAFGRFII